MATVIEVADRCINFAKSKCRPFLYFTVTTPDNSFCILVLTVSDKKKVKKLEDSAN
jgi:hypothetical protein